MRVLQAECSRINPWQLQVKESLLIGRGSTFALPPVREGGTGFSYPIISMFPNGGIFLFLGACVPAAPCIFSHGNTFLHFQGSR